MFDICLHTVETLSQDIPTRYPDPGMSEETKTKTNPCQKNVRYPERPGFLIFWSITYWLPAKSKIKICQNIISISSQNFQNSIRFYFYRWKSTWHTLFLLKLTFFCAQRLKTAIAGASMFPMGRDLENPSLTSGGQIVTLVKNLTDVLS